MKVVTGVVGNDIHVVANRLIDISLEERGFEVFNLGVNTYLEEFMDAVIETDADVLSDLLFKWRSRGLVS